METQIKKSKQNDKFQIVIYYIKTKRKMSFPENFVSFLKKIKLGNSFKITWICHMEYGMKHMFVPGVSWHNIN